jgi:hypothetical protein
MDIFYTVVLGIAAVLLILILTYVGLLISKSKDNVEFPPRKTDCPDYWRREGLVCKIPLTTEVNIGSLYNGTTIAANRVTSADKFRGAYNSTDKTINFDHTSWASTGLSKTCAQKNWANQNGIVWDGVSNYNGC